MNTRRTRRTEAKNEGNHELNTELKVRKRQTAKIDSEEEKPAEVKNELIVKPRTERKRSKFDTDDEDDENDEDDAQDEPNTSQRSRKRTIRKIESDGSSSSSDSSVGDYLKTADEIDLDSSFFNVKDEKPPDFASLEQKMFCGIHRLSESESEPDIVDTTEADEPTNSQININNFTQLNIYNKKLEDAKACVEKYKTKKSKQTKKAAKVDKKVEDISKLLSIGETKRDSVDSFKKFESDDGDDGDEHDWEEIEEKEDVKIPKEGVEITVKLPDVIRKKPKGVDLMAAIKRRINRIKKENQVYVHKVHLLCWLAHGNFLNGVLNSEILLAQALSLIPSEQCYPPKHADIKYLEQIARWYGKIIKITEGEPDNQTPISEQLNRQICTKKASCTRNFVLLFIVIMRSLGLQCRLVLSFQCLPLRPANSELCSLSTKEKESNKDAKPKNNTKENKDKGQPSTSKISNNKSVKSKPATVNTSIKNKLNKTLNDSIKSKMNQSMNSSRNGDLSRVKKSKTSAPKTSKEVKKTSSKKLTIKEKLENNSEPSTSTPISKSKKLSLKEKLEKNKVPQLDGADDSDSDADSKPVTRKSSKSTIPKSKSESKPRKKESISSKLNKNLANSEDEFCASTTTKRRISRVRTDKKSPDINHNKKVNRPSTSKTSSVDVRSDIVNLIKGQISEARNLERPKTSKNCSDFSDYDSDFKPEIPKKKRVLKTSINKNSKQKKSGHEFEINTKVKRRIPPRSELDRRAISSDEATNEPKKKLGNDVWIEVFLEEEEKWISVDLTKGQVHCISELHNRASHPISYIVAWNNNLSLKDITARYCPNWNTVTRKLRVDSVWWAQSLKPFVGVKSARDKEEDEDLARQQLDKPLPTTISEYKNHPLYALKRHLLKFEAIYPPDAITLGFVRKEAVYARECVHTLHSREIWVKHAKVVKPNQTPYKIVKARPKYDKLTGNTITDLPLEIFGPWQVEDYVPPTAENGIVPRNAFGNVELFKACMLPKKTVHLQLPSLNKVAKKLQIDCAPAVVGFDYHCGGSHPTFDGYVVCEEFKDVLIAAWEEDQEETAKRDLEKYEKRVYGNWRKLIKGLLIRERLKKRYDFGNPTEIKKIKPSKAKKSKNE